MLGLMFMAGFEVDVTVLKRQWRASLGIGTSAFVVPASGMFLVCRLLLGFDVMPSGLIAIGLSTTSLALVYQFLRERGRLQGDVGQTILGAATTVDLLSTIALAASCCLICSRRTGWSSRSSRVWCSASSLLCSSCERVPRLTCISSIETRLHYAAVLLVAAVGLKFGGT